MDNLRVLLFGGLLMAAGALAGCADPGNPDESVTDPDMGYDQTECSGGAAGAQPGAGSDGAATRAGSTPGTTEGAISGADQTCGADESA